MVLPSLIVALLAGTIGFHVVPAPQDTVKPPSFILQGYVSEADQQLLNEPQFTPASDRTQPSVYVSFNAPLSGRCALSMWETVNGKTSFALLRVLPVTSGERQFVHARLPRGEDLSSIWPGASLEDYGIAVFCAVTEGEGSGPESLRDSEYYQIPLNVASR